MRGVLLAVAVDAAVALLEDHERPGDVEVDHPVAEEVEVDALRGHVGGDEEPNRGLFLAEVLDDPLLLDVGQAAVEHLDLFSLQAEVRRQVLFEELQGLDALGEDDQPVPGSLPVQPKPCWLVPDELQELLVLAEVAGRDLLRRRRRALQGPGCPRRQAGILGFPAAGSIRFRMVCEAGRRAREEGLLEGGLEELARRARAGRCWVNFRSTKASKACFLDGGGLARGHG